MLEVLFPIYLLPLAGCLLLCFPYRFSEKLITTISSFCLLLPALITLFLFLSKGFYGLLPLEHRVVSFSFLDHTFDLIFWMDTFSVVMMLLTHVLGLLVVKYSHGYLHLEKGYQRFFCTTLFFIFGMYLISLAGTIDIFFAGWEIVGFSSFMLIAFYRSHIRSVVNAWRIYNIYRICDVGLLMGAVMGHYFWHEATRFSEIAYFSPENITEFPRNMVLLLSFFLVFASIGKSAQFPFHGWPSKAMEGPTPSSAIFYGALSIHAGVFLLIRTFNLWSLLWEVRVFVGVIGTLTFFLATIQGRVQSNIKGQIAFASTANIGIMFIELALGYRELAMFHLFFHALYRCFQLLLSPSIVASALTLNNKVVMDKIKSRRRWEVSLLSSRFHKTLYTLALNDFSMDPSSRGFRFLHWKIIHSILKKFLSHPSWVMIAVLLLSPLLLMFFTQTFTMAINLSFFSLYFSLRALLYQYDPYLSLRDLALSLLLDMVSMYAIDHHSLNSVKMFMISVLPALLTGLFILRSYRYLNLRDFHAEGTNHPLHANLFLLVFMVLSGMPISTAFFGEDLILEELIRNSTLMAFFTMVSLMLNGLICVRIYTRIFMGKKSAVPGIVKH